MMKRPFPWLLVLVALLTSNETPTVYQNTLLQHELASLTERGLAYRWLTNDRLEATDPLSGNRWVFNTESLLSPRKPTHAVLPTLTVDLRTIDTNQYNWRFHYVNSFPLTGAWGFPLQAADINRNGMVEAYGVRQTQADISTRLYEQDANNSWNFKHQYPDNSGRVDMKADIDQNELKEVYMRYGDSLFVFEQVVSDSFPKAVKFHHRQWYQSATGIPNELFDMNGDNTKEILYRGSRLDSLGQPNIEKTFVMRFNLGANNLEEIWSAQLPPGCREQGCCGAIAAGDFDGDGISEFVTSNFAGNVYVVEHVVGGSFAVTWSTNLSVAGRVTAGDVDGNGIIEFFVGGTQLESDGYVHLRGYAFERIGDNTFQPVFHFNIFPTGILFVDLYQTADIDGDDIPEFLISTAGGIVIIKGVDEHNYELFYYQSPFALDGVAAWKINNNQVAHLFVSRSIGSQQVISRTDVYRLDSALIVGLSSDMPLPSMIRLFQNHPNPFNPTTTISYDLPFDTHVSLKIYDVLGREVLTLIDAFMLAGYHHATLDATSFASGVYIYRLQSGSFTATKKLLLLR